MSGEAVPAGEFYDRLARYYDEMTGLDKRIETLARDLAPWVRRQRLTRVLDAGCGTGAACIALARLGVQATGIDVSSEMVEAARRNALQRGLQLPFEAVSLPARVPKFHGSFDAILVLANTISHFQDRRSLERLLANCRDWLSPNGVVVIQLLNYERIYARRERIVKIDERERRIFVRFHDFARRRLTFNLLVIDHGERALQYELYSTVLRSWRRPELDRSLTASGFGALTHLESWAGEKFEPQSSPDLIIVGRRQA